MKSAKKKIISVLLMFAMAAVFVPMFFATPAQAATTVDVDGGTYKALNTAINTADASTTIRLTKDISITTNNNIWIENKSFTLDLNGHSISNNQREALYVKNSNIKVINSSSTQAKLTGTNWGGIELLENSTVRIEGAITINDLYVYNGAAYIDDPQVTVSKFHDNASRNKTYYYQYSVSSWAELQHAAALAPKDGKTAATITLTADIPAEKQYLYVTNGHNLTLNMNGHNITSTHGNSAIYTDGTFTLTIKNTSSTRSSINGTVNTSSTSGMGAIWAYGSGGNFYIQDTVTLNGIYGNGKFYIDSPNVTIGNFFGSTTSNTYYKVSYNANGGTNPPAANYKRYTTNLALSSTAPTRNGYTLKGWNTAANGTGTNYGFTYNTNAATTLYAQWSQNQNLTYNANGHGTAPSTVTMTYNAATNAAAAISATGYTFNGWNTKSDGKGTAYNAGAQVKAANADPAATTLYAQWTANTYTIAYNANGGENAPGNTSATYDANATLAAAPTRTGYTFAGWNTVQGGTGTSYAAGAAVMNLAASGTVTLYAQWTVNSYSVTLNSDGGAWEALTDYTFGVGATLPIPTKSGHLFGGWYADNNFSGSAVTAISTTDTGDKTFYAKWNAASELTPELSGGNINLGFTTTASAYKDELEYTAGDKLNFVICDGDTVIKTSEVTDLNAKTEVKFSVNPAEITIGFTAKLVNETKNKTEEIGTVSMADYCHTMIKQNSDQKLVTLCKSILDYGCAAQDLFLGEHKETDEANLDPLKTGANVPTKAVLTEANFPKIKADMSFFALENATVRLYFDTVLAKDSFSISDPNKIGYVKYDEVEANEDNLMYQYVEIQNIKPSDLGKTFTVKLNEKEYSYSALQCVYDIKEACEGMKFNAAEVLYPSLVNYYLAASAYFGN